MSELIEILERVEKHLTWAMKHPECSLPLELEINLVKALEKNNALTSTMTMIVNDVSALLDELELYRKGELKNVKSTTTRN